MHLHLNLNKIMKNKLTASLLLIVAIAALIIGSYRPAIAGQYDVAYPIRSSGTGSMSLPYTGSNSQWQTIPAASANGAVQTTGSGLVVNATPIIAGTAAIATAGATPVPGQLGISSSGTLVIYGTNSAWRNVP
jgi:hypothetical protein